MNNVTMMRHFRNPHCSYEPAGRKEAEPHAFSIVLDRLAAALFLVDAGGRIVHANAAGRALIEKAEVLRSFDGRLVARDMDADKRLREILAAQCGAAAAERDRALALRATNGDRYIARFLPLAGPGQANAADAAVAALLVRRAVFEGPFPSEVIGQIYGLTPAELRVLLGIVERAGIAEVAAALGIGATTVKTHLRRIFEKTGTSRQSDLIRLVAGYSLPLTA